MMSFYGGKHGKAFEINAVFANKAEMDADLAKRFNSEVPINSFVAISYGRKNTTEYEDNKKIDQDKYQEQFDSTLWIKVYSEAPLEGSSADLNRYGIQYKLIYDLAGQTPTISFVDSVELAPAEKGYIAIVTEDINDPNYPKLQAFLPRAANWYSGTSLTSTDKVITQVENDKNSDKFYAGDLYINEYDGSVFRCLSSNRETQTSSWEPIGSILGPTLEVRKVETTMVSSEETVTVTITQDKDSRTGYPLPPIDFDFKIPRGTRFFTGQGTYSGDTLTALSNSTDNAAVKNGDLFLESNVSGKIGFIYIKTVSGWAYKTSIFGKTPELKANSVKVNPDKAISVKVTYPSGDTAFNNPTFTIDVPRGSKWFTQSEIPVFYSANTSLGLAGAADGDFWFNITDGFVYEAQNKKWVKAGSFVVDLTNTRTLTTNPYTVNNNTVTPKAPSFDITIDEDNPAVKPLVTATLPVAPVINVNSKVTTLAPGSQGAAAVTYNQNGLEIKLSLPQGVQGEMGKGLNVRRSYDSIADRNADTSITWKDGDACTVRISAGSAYYDIWIYQSDYAGNWVYTGTLLISSIDDSRIDESQSWSSKKISDELGELTERIDTAENNLNKVENDLTTLINQNINTAITNLEQKVTGNTTNISKNATAIAENKKNITSNTNEINSLKTRVTTAENNINTANSNIAQLRTDLTATQKSVTDLDGTLTEKINKIVVKLNAPLTWGDLKNGLNIT